MVIALKGATPLVERAAVRSNTKLLLITSYHTERTSGEDGRNAVAVLAE